MRTQPPPEPQNCFLLILPNPEIKREEEEATGKRMNKQKLTLSIINMKKPSNFDNFCDFLCGCYVPPCVSVWVYKYMEEFLVIQLKNRLWKLLLNPPKNYISYPINIYTSFCKLIKHWIRSFRISQENLSSHRL